MLYENFTKGTAMVIPPFVKNAIAAQPIRVEGEFDPVDIRRAWDALWYPHNWIAFNPERHCQQFDIRLVALIGRAIQENYGEPGESPAFWLSYEETGTVAMSDEEIAAWFQTPAAKELISIVAIRYKVARAIAEFEFAKRRIYFGEYRGIPLFVDASVRYGNADTPTNEEAEELKRIARLYIDAAFSINPKFRAAGLNARYAKNNLPYLVREYGKSRRLLRVFIPFGPSPNLYTQVPDASDDSPEIISAWRYIYSKEPVEGEPAYPCTAEVQFLLWAAT